MRTLTKFSILCILMLYGTTIIAQKISGTVTTGGTPLQGISVTAKPSNKGVATNKDGKYSLSLTAGTYEITFTAAGFQPVVETVTLSGAEEKTVDADLVVSTEILEDIIIELKK